MSNMRDTKITKRAAEQKPADRKVDVLSVRLRKGETDQEGVARYALSPGVNAAVTIKNVNKGHSDLPLDTLVAALSKQCEAVNNGDLARAEDMLITQAHTLDALFNQLVIRATANQGGGYLDAADRYMRLALRAQNQCRGTLETLATIKNPPNVAFVKQANIANGPQQVNNGFQPGSRAQESGIEQSKLLEHSHGERLEFGASQSAGGAHSTVETVGTVNRAAGTKRKSDRGAE